MLKDEFVRAPSRMRFTHHVVDVPTMPPDTGPSH
jgi:hypothetical protein